MFTRNYAIALSKIGRQRDAAEAQWRYLTHEDTPTQRFAYVRYLMRAEQPQLALEQVEGVLAGPFLGPGDRAQGLFLRAQLRWLAGERAAGVGDLEQAWELAPHPSTALWLALFGEGAERYQSLAADTEQSVFERLIGRWLAGEVDDAELLAEAEALVPASQLNEAHCVVRTLLGSRAELRGDRAAALEHYQAAVATGLHQLAEHTWSLLAARRLR